MNLFRIGKLIIVCSAVCTIGLNSVCLADDPTAHVNSICGNGTSHSISKIWNEDGSYSLCESYMNGRTGRRWSKFYTSWDNQWTYSGNPPGAPYRRESKKPTWNPQIIQPAKAQGAWIKNPFFKNK